MDKLNRQFIKTITFCTFTFLFTGCSTLSYYSQSIQGQLEVIGKSEPIIELLQKDNLSAEYREKLNTVEQLRAFSTEELGLPDNDSYSSFADLGRDYVIWNIFANPEFSLEPVNWCYFIVGCLSYRGYFSKQDAERHEAELKEQGYDTYLGGVAAYSTLGWFDDPVLNSMLRWNESYLAKVMFHELAHQQLYIKNDTEFNESYADAVAHIGVTKWLQQKTDKKYLREYQQGEKREQAFVELVNNYKSKLNTVYQSSIDDELKRQKKRILLQEIKNMYFEMSKNWEKVPYKNWFASDINNAKLASIITYRKYVPAFLDIYTKLNNNLEKFYSLIHSLSKCKPLKRMKLLKRREINFEC